MKIRLLTSLFATLVSALAVALNPTVAQAHTTAGVPYHTAPSFSGWTRYSGNTCSYDFYNPNVVLGFTDEYVYWRPIGGIVVNNAWQYRYGEWKRALTSPTRMVYGWESQQWPDYAWKFSNGVSVVGYFSFGSKPWLGYQIYYPSKGYTHSEWLGQVSCY